MKMNMLISSKKKRQNFFVSEKNPRGISILSLEFTDGSTSRRIGLRVINK